MGCFVCHHYMRCFCRYMRCILYYEVMIPGVWVGACEKSTMQWAPILRIRHFVSVPAPVVFSWRHRNGHSVKETETPRSD